MYLSAKDILLLGPFIDFRIDVSDPHFGYLTSEVIK